LVEAVHCAVCQDVDRSYERKFDALLIRFVSLETSIGKLANG